jgi:hypothetical protein
MISDSWRRVLFGCYVSINYQLLQLCASERRLGETSLQIDHQIIVIRREVAIH